MAYTYYKSARMAAANVQNLAMAWNLYYGEPCDGDQLMKFAACLDMENPAEDHESFYVIDQYGALGYTINNGQYVQWLAMPTIPAPQEETGEVAETPEIVIKDEISTKMQGYRSLLSAKGFLTKVLITGGMMLLIWTISIIWQRYFSFATFIPKILAYLTFANGGVSSNLLYMLGGFVGKSFVMATVIALAVGGYKKLGKGFPVLIDTIKGLGGLKPFGLFVGGVGVACIMYNFFVGYARFSMTMAGIAGIVCMLMSLGGGVHFLRRMAVALTARVHPRTQIHYVDMPNANSVLAGMAVGFALSVIISILPVWGFMPYLFGFYCLIVAVVLLLVGRQGASSTNYGARAIAALLLVSSPFAANAWYLELDRVITYRTPDPNVDVEFGPGYIKEFWHDQLDYGWREDGKPKGKLPDHTTYRRYSLEMPTIINPGDKITGVFETDKNGKPLDASEAGFFDFYAFKDPDNPPKDGESGYHAYNTDKKYRKRSVETIETKNGTKKEITKYFNKDFIADPNNPDKEATDGTEFILKTGISSIATVNYVYKYHRGTPTAAVIFIPSGDKTGALIISIIGSGAAGLAAILIVLGGAGAAANGENKDNPNVPTPPRPSDPYVVHLPDGTIEYTNPITLERDYYPPGTNEEDLREQAEHVLRNKDYYTDIQNRHDQWTQEQRQQIERELADRRAAYERALAEQAARENAQQDYVERLKEKYGVKTDQELRDKISEAMAKAELEYWDNIGDAEAYEESYKFAERTKIAADVAMDGLAAFGGKKGAMVRDAYKALAEISQTMVDAGCRGKDLGEAAAVGITRAGITYIQYQTLDVGVVPHLGATVVGEGMRDAVTALYEGKSPQEVADAYIKGSIRGAENFAVDAIVGGTVKGVTGSSMVMNSADYKTATKIANSIGNVTDDVGKIYFDDKLSS